MRQLKTILGILALSELVQELTLLGERFGIVEFKLNRPLDTGERLARSV